MRGRRKGGQVATFPITVAGPLASNAQPAAAARQQAAQTPGPQIRGSTVDVVDAADDTKPNVGVVVAK